MKFNVEFTDTFGGEANYGWVKRVEIEAPWSCSDRTLMRRAKAAIGLTGTRGRTTIHGDMLEFRPYRECTVMFVTAAPATFTGVA